MYLPLLCLFLTLFAAPALADSNCCHIPGSNCQTENEWIQGYYDGVNGLCQTTIVVGQSDATPQSTPAPASAQSGDTSLIGNNCCYNGWTCTSNEQWISGYYARQAGDACTTESQTTYQPTARHQADNQARNARSSNTEIRVLPDDYEGPITYNTPVQYRGVIIRRATPEELCDAGLLEYCD